MHTQRRTLSKDKPLVISVKYTTQASGAHNSLSQSLFRLWSAYGNGFRRRREGGPARSRRAFYDLLDSVALSGLLRGEGVSEQ